jgi:hypothetical protein
MPATFLWNGLIEARVELEQLPAALTAEATTIVEQVATTLAANIRAAYPARTGRLRGGVYVARASALGRFNVAVVVRNRNPLAGIFEYGTQARHTKIGANRGSMPPGHVFVPRMQQARVVLVSRLAALVERHGLVVVHAAA